MKNRNEIKETHLNDMPKTIKQLLLSYMDYPTILKLKRTCKDWQAFINENPVAINITLSAKTLFQKNDLLVKDREYPSSMEGAEILTEIENQFITIKIAFGILATGLLLYAIGFTLELSSDSHDKAAAILMMAGIILSLTGGANILFNNCCKNQQFNNIDEEEAPLLPHSNNSGCCIL